MGESGLESGSEPRLASESLQRGSGIAGNSGAEVVQPIFENCVRGYPRDDDAIMDRWLSRLRSRGDLVYPRFGQLTRHSDIVTDSQ